MLVMDDVGLLRAELPSPCRARGAYACSIPSGRRNRCRRPLTRFFLRIPLFCCLLALELRTLARDQETVADSQKPSGPLPPPPTRALRTPTTAAERSIGLWFFTFSIALYDCACPKFRSLRLNTPRLCCLAVLSTNHRLLYPPPPHCLKLLRQRRGGACRACLTGSRRASTKRPRS